MREFIMYAVGFISRVLFFARTILPAGFWIISMCGSAMTLIYAVSRLDPVLLTAHSLSLFIYLRNILTPDQRGGLLGHLNHPVLDKLVAFFSGSIH